MLGKLAKMPTAKVGDGLRTGRTRESQVLEVPSFPAHPWGWEKLLRVRAIFTQRERVSLSMAQQPEAQDCSGQGPGREEAAFCRGK